MSVKCNVSRHFCLCLRSLNKLGGTVGWKWWCLGKDYEMWDFFSCFLFGVQLHENKLEASIAFHNNCLLRSSKKIICIAYIPNAPCQVLGSEILSDIDQVTGSWRRHNSIAGHQLQKKVILPAITTLHWKKESITNLIGRVFSNKPSTSRPLRLQMFVIGQVKSDSLDLKQTLKSWKGC